MSGQQNAGQNHNIFLIAEKFFENVANINYLGRTITNKKCIHEEVKRRLHFRNSCHHSVHKPLLSLVL
jgi:hypothetical protein